MKELLKSQNDWLEELGAMKQRSHCYMVLDTQDLTEKDRKRLELSMSILGVCQTLATLNTMLKKLGTKKEFNSVIMYEALNAVINSKSLPENKLEEYHEFLREYNKIRGGLALIDRHIGDIWVDPDIDLLMLGFSLEEIEKIYNWSSDKIGIDTYYDVQEDYAKGKISFKEFIAKSRKTLNAILSEPVQTKQ